MPTNLSSMLRKSLSIVAVMTAVLFVAFGILHLWWHWPVSVEAKNIVKVTSSEIKDLEEEVAYCAAFTMTPEQFRTYWKNVRPIFASEFHDYSFGACYFKATEQGKEFLVGVGGVGIINKGDTPYYYVDKNAKSDLSGLD